MLRQLEISNYALIENLSIELNSGLTVITGETGAGKSIILKAIGLILGDRADTSIIKQNENKCVLEAHFDITKLDLKNFFDKKDIDFENLTILRREFSSSGKSRCFVNDTPVQLSLLKELGIQLISLHSQHETLLINSTKFQFQILDEFSGISDMVAVFQKDYKSYQTKLNEKINLQLKEMQNRKDKDYLSFLENELTEAGLENINTEELTKRTALIENSQKIVENLNYAMSVIDNDTVGPKVSLKALLEAFDNLKSFGTNYTDIYTRLSSLKIEIDDLDNEIGSLLDDVEIDEEEAKITMEKQDLLNTLCYKHNVSDISELILLQGELQIKLAAIEDDSEELERLELETRELKVNLESKAANIHATREQHIPALEANVKEKLAALAMPDSRLNIALSLKAELTPYGSDNISYLFSANKGSAASELKKVASGGEMSRLMLALLDINASLNKLPTMIFDEIDTGVSGEVASRMAASLKSMGKKMQVLCITHLPQVAAAGKEHLFVSKKSSDNKTHTEITKLSKDKRVLALAQMLSGEKITEVAKENAQLLLKSEEF